MNSTTTYTPERDSAGSLPLQSEHEIVASGQNLPRLAMVGRVTANGRVILSVRTAEDGSQIPIGFTVAAVNATAAHTSAPIYKAGVLDANAVHFHSSWTIAQAIAALDQSPLFLRAPLSL